MGFAVRKDPTLRQYVLDEFVIIASIAIMVKLSPAFFQGIGQYKLEEKILEISKNPCLYETYYNYVKQIFKIF